MTVQNSPLLYLRAFLFSLVFAFNTIVHGLLLSLLMPFSSFQFRYRLVGIWGRINLFALKWLCNLDMKIEGQENMPVGPAIVLAKHQSTWETILFTFLFPPQAWVLKRELLRIPFFGWGLKAMNPIAIDRSSGRKAVDQVVTQGKERLRQGLWVIIFPEGTRTPPGKKPRYKLGGAILAEKSGYPVVPIALDSGSFWPKGQFVKLPGSVTVRIGPVIESDNLSAEEISAKAEAWIEAQMKILQP